jgi:hypothetical protein
LADRLKYSHSVIYGDVEIILEYGIIQYRKVGKSEQPLILYETIGFDVTIHTPLRAMILKPQRGNWAPTPDANAGIPC